MLLNKIEIRHLRHFNMLCQKGSFSSAADALHLSQPSLSRSIQRMEELLDAPLLDRSRAGITLTSCGQLVHRHSERILQDLRALYDELEMLQAGDWSEIAIGASPIPAQTLLGPVIGALTRRHPALKLDLRVDGWKRSLARLEAGTLNYFVDEVQATGLNHHPDLEIVPLAPQSVLLCCHPSHSLLRLTHPTLEQLFEYPLALPRNLPDHFLQQQIPGLDTSKVTAGRRIVRFDQFLSVKSALYDSDLIALTPLASVHKELSTGELAVVPIQDLPKIQAHFGIVSLSERNAPPAAQKLIQAIVDEANKIQQTTASLLNQSHGVARQPLPKKQTVE
ncbi:LysR family transcriptional regulator [Ferrimonas sp. SCSIO 43195]|uniref:LysR family transcriptional regulator n=1 Tax=Ferrimonas sp. SCSIO 43195 TaxID=2822844 RepID=UPI00207601C2|nr:LysR family transcriptional regulator [Ferrimonas sp. SCSIO 43195]USD35905.1 LysR family transcriptional regulator [Ferrimonas sp. SCSIO 43195]